MGQLWLEEMEKMTDEEREEYELQEALKEAAINEYIEEQKNQLETKCLTKDTNLITTCGNFFLMYEEKS